VLSRTFRPSRPVSLGLTLAPVRRGSIDLTMRLGRSDAWRATRTPDGPATVHLAQLASGEVRVRAWGQGAPWAVETAPTLLGSDDDDSGFEPRHPIVRDLSRRFAGMRIPRTGAVVEALVPTILEQKVQGIQARRSYRSLVARFGEPAPGPAGVQLGLRVPPAPSTLAGTPSWAFHVSNVEAKRAETVRRACSAARRLEEAVSMSPADAGRRMRAVPGIGPWTAAEVALVALGDADAVSVGDYHLPNLVSWALAGEPRGDDDRMLELLEPYRGHRGRVIRLLGAGGPRAPKYGPRLPLQDIRSH
jgi:3-methyladenine DNA glycosylase/8-oxoguanine DNA glycosylase